VSVNERFPRKQWLLELLQKCRLLLASGQCLQSVLRRLSSVRDVEEEKLLVSKCMVWKMSYGPCINDASSLLSFRRKCDEKENVQVALTMFTQNRQNHDAEMTGLTIWPYNDSMSDLDSNRKKMLPAFRGLGISAAVWNDQMYVITNDRGSFQIYCTSLLCRSVPTTVESSGVLGARGILRGQCVAMVVVNNNLYVIGPDVINEGLISAGSQHITCLKFASIRWGVFLKPKVVSHGSTIVVLYNVGGNHNIGPRADNGRNISFQCYDTEKKEYYAIADILGSPKGLVTFQTFDRTFFLLANGSLYTLNENAATGKMETSFIDQLWTHRRCLLGASIVQKQLFIFHSGREFDANDQVITNLTWPDTVNSPSIDGVKPVLVPRDTKSKYFNAVVPKTFSPF